MFGFFIFIVVILLFTNIAKGSKKTMLFLFLILFGLSILKPATTAIFKTAENTINKLQDSRNFTILSSYENKDLEEHVKKIGKKNDFNIKFIYKGDLDIVDELNENSKNYDAVWISNSIWLYMLDNTYTISESKSISISPVVMGIKLISFHFWQLPCLS